MDFDIRPWIELCQKRGQIPTIAYGNILHMGRNLEPLRKLPNLLLAHTPRVEWLDTGVRLFRALWDVDHLKVLDCPCEGYYEELKTVGDTDEVKAIAEFYEKHAQAVDPICQPLMLGSAKHYVVLRRMMERHGCNGVAVEGPLCVGAGTAGNLPACLALSKLLDEGTVAQCQAAHGAHRRLTSSGWRLSLLGRPSYMGNITFDNLANRLILSHCTGALKLEGFDHDYRAPYRLRNFHANAGVSLQVSWPLGREATILDRVSMTGDKFIVAAAKVTGTTTYSNNRPAAAAGRSSNTNWTGTATSWTWTSPTCTVPRCWGTSSPHSSNSANSPAWSPSTSPAIRCPCSSPLRRRFASPLVLRWLRSVCSLSVGTSRRGERNVPLDRVVDSHESPEFPPVPAALRSGRSTPPGKRRGT